MSRNVPGLVPPNNADRWELAPDHSTGSVFRDVNPLSMLAATPATLPSESISAPTRACHEVLSSLKFPRTRVAAARVDHAESLASTSCARRRSSSPSERSTKSQISSRVSGSAPMPIARRRAPLKMPPRVCRKRAAACGVSTTTAITFGRSVGKSEFLPHHDSARVEGAVGIDLPDGIVQFLGVPSLQADELDGPFRSGEDLGDAIGTCHREENDHVSE